MIFVILMPHLDCIVLRFFYLVFPDCQDWWENHGGQDQGKPRSCWIFFPSPCCRWIQARVTFVINDSSGHLQFLQFWELGARLLVGKSRRIEVRAGKSRCLRPRWSLLPEFKSFAVSVLWFSISLRGKGRKVNMRGNPGAWMIQLSRLDPWFVINIYSCSQDWGLEVSVG